MIRKVNAAVIAALILTGASAFTMASATTVESHTDGKSIGLNLWGEQRHYTDDLTVNVSGLGVNGKKYHNNVTGIYALDGTQSYRQECNRENYESSAGGKRRETQT